MNEISIGAKIAEGRKEKGFSQAQFAELLNVSPQAVSKWERGESLPDVIMLGKIAGIIGTDMNHFANGIVEKTPAGGARGKAKDMGSSNWENADFSWLDNLDGKMNYSNVESCKFVGANLCNTTFKANNLEKNDFERANLSGCRFSMVNVENNNFEHTDLSGTEVNRSNIDKNNFSNANLTNAVFKASNFDENALNGAVLQGTRFEKCNISKVTFSGTLTDCSLMSCHFRKVMFDYVTMRNTFFKGKVKGIIFTNCKADNITREFIKSAGVDISGIELIMQ